MIKNLRIQQRKLTITKKLEKLQKKLHVKNLLLRL